MGIVLGSLVHSSPGLACLTVTDVGVNTVVLGNSVGPKLGMRWGGSWVNQEQLRGSDYLFLKPG